MTCMICLADDIKHPVKTKCPHIICQTCSTKYTPTSCPYCRMEDFRFPKMMTRKQIRKECDDVNLDIDCDRKIHNMTSREYVHMSIQIYILEHNDPEVLKVKANESREVLIRKRAPTCLRFELLANTIDEYLEGKLIITLPIDELKKQYDKLKHENDVRETQMDIKKKYVQMLRENKEEISETQFQTLKNKYEGLLELISWGRCQSSRVMARDLQWE